LLMPVGGRCHLTAGWAESVRLFFIGEALRFQNDNLSLFNLNPLNREGRNVGKSRHEKKPG
jgi:hypothetical protein